MGEKKGWKLKPKEEWMFVESPRIISDELWETCNRILDNMANQNRNVRKKGVHLFSSVLFCQCGAKMYMRSQYQKYICLKCKNKIRPDDLEEIYHGQLKGFVFSDTEIQNHLNDVKRIITEKENLLQIRSKQLQTLKQKVTEIFDLYHQGSLSVQAFKEYHDPVYENQKQVEQSLEVLQSEIDTLRIQSLDNSQVLEKARNLQTEWNSFSKEDKKNTIEAITKSIIIGKEDIEINLSYIPSAIQSGANLLNSNQEASSPRNTTNLQQTLRGSWKQ